MPTFTTEENQFLVNLLLAPDVCWLSYDPIFSREVAQKLMASLSPSLTNQDIGFLQSILQEQNEIWGRKSTTANEKQPIAAGHTFNAQSHLILIKSTSDKLGALIKVDITLRSDIHTPREEGSRSIMKNPLEPNEVDTR